MSNFFSGWQRKAGCLALFAALIFLVEWVRSSSIPARYTMDFGMDGELQIISQNNQASLVRQRFVEFRNRPLHGDRSDRVQGPKFHWKWHWERWGVLIGTGQMIQDRISIDLELQNSKIQSEVFDISIFQLPYWFLVVPLTLLSVCLLLKSPDKSGLASARRAHLENVQANPLADFISSLDFAAADDHRQFSVPSRHHRSVKLIPKPSAN